MNHRDALARGGFVAAACVACCAPPIIAALGAAAGLAALTGVFIGLAATVAVAIIGGSWILLRARRRISAESRPVAVELPIPELGRRQATSRRPRPVAQGPGGGPEV